MILLGLGTEQLGILGVKFSILIFFFFLLICRYKSITAQTYLKRNNDEM